MSEKKVEVKLTADTQALLEAMKSISTQMKSAQDFAKSLFSKDILPALDEMTIAIKSLVPPMKEVDAINQKIAENNIRSTRIAKEASQKQLEKNEAEIKSIVQTAKSLNDVLDAYKKKDELLKIQEKEEISRAKDIYNKKIELAQQFGENSETLEKERTEHLALIEKEYREKRLQSIQEYSASEKAFVEKSIEDGKKALLKLYENSNSEVLQESLNVVKEELKYMLKDYNEFQEKVNAVYQDLAKDYEDDAEALKKANEAKNKSQKETTKVLQETTIGFNDIYQLEVDKLIKKTEELTKKINTTLTQTKEFSTSLFGSISGASKAYTDGIDEEIKHLNEKNKEAEKIKTHHSTILTDLEKQKEEALKNRDAEAISNLGARIEAEKQLYNGSVKTLEEAEVKKAELERKKAKAEKEQEKIAKIERKVKLGQDIVEAGSSIAVGVTKALKYGPILGPILATIVTAMGAIQIGIMTKNLAKFEKGGLLRGKRHSEGGMRIEGTNIEVEGGEYVVNRSSTAKNLGLISYINSQNKELQAGDLGKFFAQRPVFMPPAMRRTMEEGGQIPQMDTPNSIDSDILDAIKSIDLQPRVAVTDIIRAQDQYASVENWSGV